MSRHIHPKLPAALKALSKRLEAFRSHRMRQRNLPEALWEQAVEQALQHGIFRVHQALRLNYNGLKRRVAEFPLPAKKTPSAFIELQAPSVSLVGHDVILELEERSGRKLTIRLSKDRGVEWTAAAQALWSCS